MSHTPPSPDHTIAPRRPWRSPILYTLDRIDAARAKFNWDPVEGDFKITFPTENGTFNGPATEVGPNTIS